MTGREFIVEHADGSREQRRFNLERGFNLGFTIRDEARMQAHLDEVVKEGVPRPSVDVPPIIFPISTWAWLTETSCPVQTTRTSGEVEIFMIDTEDELLVGVGSDHTDRDLERQNIPWSKQVAPNIVAPAVWRWSEIEAHWDECTLESFVWNQGERIPYQRASVAEFWTPREMVDSLEGRIPAARPRVLLSGTVVTLGHQLIYGDRWELRLYDPILKRAIEHSYSVTVLSEEIDDRAD